MPFPVRTCWYSRSRLGPWSGNGSPKRYEWGLKPHYSIGLSDSNLRLKRRADVRKDKIENATCRGANGRPKIMSTFVAVGCLLAAGHPELFANGVGGRGEEARD